MHSLLAMNLNLSGSFFYPKMLSLVRVAQYSFNVKKYNACSETVKRVA